MVQGLGRYWLFALAFGGISGGALAGVSVTQTNGDAVYRFAVEGLQMEPVTIEGVAFQALRLGGLEGFSGVLYDVGKPALPVIRLYVMGQGEISVGATPLGDDATVSTRIVPNMPPQPKVPHFGPRLVIDAAAYANEDFVPSVDYTVVAAGSLRGVARRLVTLHPVRYSAGLHAFKLAQGFTVTVKGGEPVAEPEAATKTLAMVVGAQFAQSPSLDAYMRFKRSLGYNVKTVLMQKDALAPQDVRTKLQEMLSDRANPLGYALIIGDEADVPSHPSEHITGVTDHYFRSIDTADYETDIGAPDIGVGRISVSSEAELAIVLAKNMKYERGQFASTEWLKMMTWIASNDPNYWQVAEGSFNYSLDLYNKSLGYYGAFPTAHQAGGDLLYAITHHAEGAQVAAQMKAGRGFINYGGHGGVEYWAGPEVVAADVQAMDHADALPVVIANACVTGQFTSDSFGETWLKHRNGAVMYWGSMDSTYWDEDDILQKRLYDILWRDKKFGFAQFTNLSQTELWKHYGGEGLSKYYFETYVTFGDPTMTYRSWVPATIAVASAAANHPGGVGFTVRDSNGLTTGLKVVLSDVNGTTVFAAKFADSDGKANFEVGPGVLEQGYRVTVSGPNHVLYESLVQ